MVLKQKERIHVREKEEFSKALKFLNKQACISSISIWEIGIKIKKGKLDIKMSLNEYVKKIKKISNFEIVPINENIWIESLKLEWQHNDPADRVIVATAKLREIPIFTKDRIISDFYPDLV